MSGMDAFGIVLIGMMIRLSLIAVWLGGLFWLDKENVFILEMKWKVLIALVSGISLYVIGDWLLHFRIYPPR